MLAFLMSNVLECGPRRAEFQNRSRLSSADRRLATGPSIGVSGVSRLRALTLCKLSRKQCKSGLPRDSSSLRKSRADQADRSRPLRNFAGAREADKTESMQVAGEWNPATQPRNAQFSKKFHFWLDEPADWGRSVRWLRLSGWCVAKSGHPLTAIRATLRGRTFRGAVRSRTGRSRRLYRSGRCPALVRIYH